MAGDDVVLEVRGVCKSYPGVKALDRVDLTLRAGRCTALLGENGAGKSTLMNVLAGVQPPDEGDVFLCGRPVQFTDPRDAIDHGIAMVHQELSLVPEMTVAENIFLGSEPRRLGRLIDYRQMNERARHWLELLDLNVSPTSIAGRLRVGQQQLVEIARALAGDVRILILDEPTSAITEHETEVLFRRIHDLKRNGVCIVYITHRLEELQHIADDVAVMRDGEMVGTAEKGELSQNDMIRMMAGREVKASVRASTTHGDEALRVESVSLPHPTRPADYLLQEVSLHVARGEVLGIFGLMGAGRTELLECIFGLHKNASIGEVVVDCQPAAIRSPRDAVAHGLALVPEDRKQDGLILSMTVGENVSLASLDRTERFGLLSRRAEDAHVQPLVRRFRVKHASLHERVSNLSGGNQQKVILAKWLATAPKVLLLDEPTRGIDVQAKNEIYSLINELTAEGLAVVMVTSELPEALAVSDRILVLCEGRLTAEFMRGDAADEQILHAALPRRRASPC